jgi:hypothetical protein
MLGLSTRKRVLRGLIGGAGVAVLLSGLATIGRVTMGADAYQRANGSWLLTMVAYFSILPVFGAIVGLCVNLARYWWGAVILGSVGWFLLMMGFVALGSMGDVPLKVKVIATCIVSFLLGGGLGLQRWSVYRQKGSFF